VLFGALRAAAAAFQTGERDRDRLLAVARARIAAEPRAHLDYLELRSEPGLEPLPPGACTAGRLLVAARFLDGARPVRLLDNIALGQADAASVP
jgi:pantoate--beta-alanine ligase